MEELKIKIKYFEGATKLQKISKGDWIDLYAAKDVIIKEKEMKLVPLGVAMELPEGYEAHVAPRSSTFKTWGVIETNSIGIIDHSYMGDNDQWLFPVYCLEPKHVINGVPCTVIHKGDKIAQFRIIETMPEIEFEEVEFLGNANRGGHGSTGTK